MSDSEEHKSKQQLPYLDPSLIVDTRLREIEQQQTEEKRKQQEYNRRQLRFNGLLVIFTGLLFLTSIASDLLTLRYVGLTKQIADAARDSADSAKFAMVLDEWPYMWASKVELISPVIVGQVIDANITFASSEEFVGDLPGSALGLSEKAVKLAAGGVEGTLLVFRAVMNEWAAEFVDRLA